MKGLVSLHCNPRRTTFQVFLSPQKDRRLMYTCSNLTQIKICRRKLNKMGNTLILLVVEPYTTNILFPYGKTC